MKKREAAAPAEWAGLLSRWDAVDAESDKKFFNLVEGAAEENRLNQRTEAELIAHRDWKNVELVDPLTKLPINNLKEILQDYNVSLDQIYIQSHHFDPETYLRSVHAKTSINEFKRCLNVLKE